MELTVELLGGGFTHLNIYIKGFHRFQERFTLEPVPLRIVLLYTVVLNFCHLTEKKTVHKFYILLLFPSE